MQIDDSKQWLSVRTLASTLFLLGFGAAVGAGVYAFYYSQQDAVKTSLQDEVTTRQQQIFNNFQKGLNGSQGGRGPTGGQGGQGPPGPDGVVGAQGKQGPVGPIGKQGAKGRDGLISPPGAKGPIGANGTDWTGVGPNGTTGDTGSTGDPGAQGPYSSSAYGPTGGQGPIGGQGTRGNTGGQGIQGITGATGGPGPRGISPTGPVGPTGEAGNGGPDGFQGGQGSGGDTGPTVVRQDWVFGDGSDGDLTVDSTVTLYRDVHAITLNVTQTGKILNPGAYLIYAQREIVVWGSIEVTANTSAAGWQAGLGGYAGNQTGSPPTGSSCTATGFGWANNSASVTKCVEWDYYLQMPAHFVRHGVARQVFAVGGGAAGGGDSLWEAFYDKAFCESNDWVYCGGPGGQSGGFLYLASPSVLGNGTLAVPGGDGTLVEIGGYGGNGGGGGLIVIHAFSKSAELQFITRGGTGGRSGYTLEYNSTTYLPPGTNGTSGQVYLNLATFTSL